jgi:hypothetical protein
MHEEGFKASASLRIRTLKGGWKFAEDNDRSEYVAIRRVELRVQGNKKQGYHLIMTPDGLFTADTHHPDLQDALRAAEEAFGVSPDDWSKDVADA